MMRALQTCTTNEEITSNYNITTKDLCLVPCHVTFVSRKKVKFYREFFFEQPSDIMPYLVKEAQFTISKLETSLLYRKGIIEKVTSDINKSEQIIYFDVILSSGGKHTSFSELLSYLNTVFLES